MNENDIRFFLHLGYFPRYKAAYPLGYDGIDRSRYDGWDDTSLIEEGARIFQETIDTRFQSGVRNIVPISGGMDSRALLGGLLECTEAQNIETYSFGTPGTYDYDLGNLVARHCGVAHEGIDLAGHDWSLSDFVSAAERFDHQTFVFHHAPIDRLSPYEGGVTWSGYIGDAVTGGHLQRQPSGNLDAAKLRYLDKRCESKSACVLDCAPYGLSQLIGGGDFSPDFLSYDEQVLFDEVGNITAPHVLMGGFDYQTPFINSPIWDFFMSVPDAYRRDQRLFIAVMFKLYPDLFGLPAKTAYGLRIDSYAFLKLVRRARNKIWNIGRTRFKGLQWPALPMTNFFDIDKMLIENNVFQGFVYNTLEGLIARDAVPWIDVNAIWARHMSRQANHGDVIKILFSLELNLRGRETCRSGDAL